MRLQYILEQAISNLRRNVLVVFAAIVAVFVMLALVLGSRIVGWGIKQDIGRWDDNVRVIAFLSDDLGIEEIDAMQADIQGWDEVDEVIYFTKSQALDEFREIFSDQPSLIEIVEEDPSILPASLRVKPTEAANYSTIRDRLVVMPGIFQVQSAEEAIDNLVARAGKTSSFALWFGIVLALAALVLIANTIRIAIFARRDEIGIMKLVGAGNWFVRIPFLLEGMIEGVIGAIIAVALVWPNAGAIAGLFSTTGDLNPTTDFLIGQAVVMLGFGAGTGLLGSAFGMWGFLRD